MTRKDLSYEQQAVQSVHAAIQWIFEHPSRAGPWWKESNYLGLLCVNNEKQLMLLAEKCDKLGLAFSIFREPDIGNAITGIAIEPSLKSKKLVEKIPLLKV